MSGKEAGHYGCTKRTCVPGERVLGKSQGAHGLGVMGITSHEGSFQGAKQDPTARAHPIPRMQGSGGSPRSWALSWDWAELGYGLTGRAVRKRSPELLQGGSGSD